MYGICHHPVWTFVCPSPYNKLEQLTFTLREGTKEMSAMALEESEQIIRQNGTGKYTRKL
jgi:hypothetical protein